MAATAPNPAKRPAYKINPPVFIISALLTIGFALCGTLFPDATSEIFSAIQSYIVDTFGWFYLLAVAIFLIFTLGLALSAYGNIRLGPDDSIPDFGYGTWFAMLFSAGMGIGLMFFGVAEPIMHYTSPVSGQGETVEAARDAMVTSFFHWGVHAWAIYAVIGLSLAYFSFRHNLPLTIRSSLFPLIGERIHGPIGHTVDIFAVLGTMFGVATSLGLGVLQVNSGIAYLFGIEESVNVQMVLIAIITAMAAISVVSGLDVGIRRLSELNLFLAVALVVFVLVAGPTTFLLQAVVQNTGAYLSDIVNRTFTLYAYEPSGWIGGWTLFYWAWWIAWSPFVGMFIARVSRGRTIREFVTGVLFVPVGFTFIWMTVFGNTAISLDQGIAQGAVAAAVSENVSTALFRFFEFLPLTQVASVVATILVITFFVTSSDSGSLVIDTITAGGETDAPTWQRLFWALSEGVVAAVLLLAGGLQALQMASITAALPFALVMLFVCYGLLKGLRNESFRRMSQELPAMIQITGAEVPWQQRLHTIVNYPRRRAGEEFLVDTARPALEEVAEEVRKTGLDATVTSDERSVTLRVTHDGQTDFLYGIRLKGYDPPEFALRGLKTKDRVKEGRRYYRAEVHLLEGGQHYDVLGYTREQVISDVLSQYQKHMHFLHIAR